MLTLHIAEAIDAFIEQKILKEWKHEGYMNGWDSERVTCNIDGTNYVITIRKESEEAPNG